VTHPDRAASGAGPAADRPALGSHVTAAVAPSGASPTAGRSSVGSSIHPALGASGASSAARPPGPGSTITVLVAGRNAAGLAAILAERRTFHVIAAPPGLSLSDQIATAAPDVLVFDAGSGRAAGVARRLAREMRLPPTVVLSDDPVTALRADAVRAGLRAILPRPSTPAEMAVAIEAVAAGLVVAHPSGLAGHRGGAAVARSTPGGAARQSLTPREVEVLGMIAEGFGNRSIAARIGISQHTVKFHIAAILAKLDASSRTEAVTIGLRQGLIMI
jgi:DNA-binding NarL/FixJ family response regulator